MVRSVNGAAIAAIFSAWGVRIAARASIWTRRVMRTTRRISILRTNCPKIRPTRTPSTTPIQKISQRRSPEIYPNRSPKSLMIKTTTRLPLKRQICPSKMIMKSQRCGLRWSILSHPNPRLMGRLTIHLSVARRSRVAIVLCPRMNGNRSPLGCPVSRLDRTRAGPSAGRNSRVASPNPPAI